MCNYGMDAQHRHTALAQVGSPVAAATCFLSSCVALLISPLRLLLFLVYFLHGVRFN
jgi:hypothetical protein